MSNKPRGDSSPDRPSSTASSSLHKRHGLSPRQRRLLQAAARARANSNAESTSPRVQTTDEQSSADPPVSPSRITPASLSTSLSPIDCITPYDEALDSTTISHNKSLPFLEKQHKSAGSGVSTATTDATTVSIGSRFSRLQLSPIDDVNEGELADVTRGQVSDHVKRFSNYENAKSESFQFNEEDEIDTNEDPIKKSLNSQNDMQRSIQPKLQTYQKQSSPEKVRNEWKKDILKTAARQMELRYYRVVYPGVVSLMCEIPTTVGTKPLATSNGAGSKRSISGNNVYLGCGEIVATSSPEITISLSELEVADGSDNRNTTDIKNKLIRAIRVDTIITGGYNSVEKACVASDPSTPASWKNSTILHHGYLLLENKFGQVIAESITPSKPGKVGPSYETGSFVYRVRASSPVRVLSGPDINAPSMKCALLPGTMHNVSFRVSLPVLDQNDSDDILVDDADAGEVKFLRLAHRKGWVADRKIGAVGDDFKRLRVSYLMEDISEEQNLNNTSLSLMSPSGSVNMSHSLDCSSLNLSVSASSVTTPPNANSKRHRRSKRRCRETQNISTMLHDNRRPGDSFDTESSATGFGSGTVVSTTTDSFMNKKFGSRIEVFYLNRVLAPRGLKILDAPHFQVSELIHTPTEQNKIRTQSPAGISPFARTNATIGSSSVDSSPSSFGALKKGQRIRFLARGQCFEASSRMESTDAASLYTSGQGLVKLADGSGWVIIPHHQDLVTQYETFKGSSVDSHEILAFEELGEATINKLSLPSDRFNSPDKSHTSTTKLKNQRLHWLRIVSTNGVKVLLPPAEMVQRFNNEQSNNTPPKFPTSIKHSPSSHDSEVASVVSSSFFDSVWNKVTPSKQKGSASSIATTTNASNKQFGHQQFAYANQPRNLPLPPVAVIACGMVVPIESYNGAASGSAERNFVRLFNGQGWIPQRVVGTVCACEVGAPEARFGSFWFRVQSHIGIDVRHGPSCEAPFITSDCGHSFRFECGEFLRASEVLTIFQKASNDKSDSKVECFARLYRKNQGFIADASDETNISRYSSIQYLTSPGEWVMVHSSDELFLEECSTPPSVERNREGWRCSTITDVSIRTGPSYQADATGKVIRADEEFFVTEKVRSGDDDVIWFRLKNDEGWVHSSTEGGVETVHCHLTDFSRKMVRNIINK